MEEVEEKRKDPALLKNLRLMIRVDKLPICVTIVSVFGVDIVFGGSSEGDFPSSAVPSA